jgi:hypothetical protein
MTTFTRVWDTSYEGDPDDGDEARFYADRVRKLKVDTRERAEVDHIWKGADNDEDGTHKKVTLEPQGADPTGQDTNQSILYSKVSSGITELFYREDSASGGTVTQLTQDGKVRMVPLTGAGTPAAVTGDYVGQRYFDSTNIGWYTCTAAGAPGTWVPDIAPGTIMIWNSTVGSIPNGWKRCDGTNGTPDLRGRVVVGLDEGQTEFDTVGETGGAKTHTLVVGEMPSHRHQLSGHGDAGTTGVSKYNVNATRDLGITDPDPLTNSDNCIDLTGGGGAHNNLQPYAAYVYIQKK